MALNFEQEKLEKELDERQPKKAMVQLPEGIKRNALEIQEIFEKKGIEVIFSGETAWGACSIALHEAQAANVDLLVHFGHAKFIEADFPIVYIEVRDEMDLLPLAEKSLENLKGCDKIGLAYSIQHKHEIEKLKKFYEDNGKEVFIPKKQGYAAEAGHVVGCEYSGLRVIEEQVDCFVVIGNQFHSMGAALAVKKPIFLMDAYNYNVRDMHGVREKIIKQRVAAIEKFKESQTIGIIIEVKPGQQFGSPKSLVKKFREKGKNVVVITMDELTPEKIMNFYHIDGFVELACPRIATDDYAKYEKPILTFKEALIALGEKTWEDIEKIGLI